MADTIAGRFELLEPIAKGGSGAVWRALDHKVSRECAAKVLRQRDSADLLRFVREQMVKLDHPHVVAPYGWAAEDEYVVIAMELVNGGTMEAALGDNGAVADFVAEEILWQVLQALQFVHARGLIHRDVKPANLLLEPTGSGRPWVRLADFGIAVRADDARLTHTGTVVGTPGYLPQEAYAPMEPSIAVDLYAAGVTAVRLVHPHVDLSSPLGPEAVHGLFENSEPLRRHVAGLLSNDPAERIATAALAAHELAETASLRADRTAMTAEGEPFEVFDILSPTTERELSVIPDAAVLPSDHAVPTAPIAWHAVRRQTNSARETQAIPAPPRFSDDPLNPFGDTTRGAVGPARTEPVPASSRTQELPQRHTRATARGTSGTSDTANSATRTTARRGLWRWVLPALVLAPLALIAGYLWLGPALTGWLDPADQPQPALTPTPGDVASPSVAPQPGVDITPECTEQQDGSLSCVLTP